MLEAGVDKKQVYFPNVDWYDINGNLVFKKNISSHEGGNVTFDVSLPNKPIPWFIREGTIVIWQDATDVMTA